MPPPVLTVGIDERGLLLEAPVLKREHHPVEGFTTGRDLLARIPGSGTRLIILGTCPDPIPGLVERIRTGVDSRTASVLVLLTAGAAEVDSACVEAGANGVLRRPLDRGELETWVAKLLQVARRVQARLPVQGTLVGSMREPGPRAFEGFVRNVSVNGMLLASPIALPLGKDLEFELGLPGAQLRGLGRVVREAPEIAWPHRGYGVEFLFLPPDAFSALTTFVVDRVERPPAVTLPPDPGYGIHATIRREAWVYELVEPQPRGEMWQVEIRRAARESWRPGRTGPFYVVEGTSPEQALVEARAFVVKMG